MKKQLIYTFCILLVSFTGINAQNLFTAIREEKIEVLKSILENNPEEILKKQDGLSPLFYAVRIGKNKAAEFLISKGAEMNEFAKDINEFSPREFTPITDAIRTNNIEIIKLMIENGANVHKSTSLGETYLHFAAFLNRIELIEYFISKGIDVNVKKNGNLTSLHIAAITGYEDIARLLIVKGADINCKSSDGGTALHFAEAAGNNEIVNLLIEKGAKKESRNFPIYKGKYLGIKSPDAGTNAFAPELFKDIYRVHSTPSILP